MRGRVSHVRPSETTAETSMTRLVSVRLFSSFSPSHGSDPHSGFVDGQGQIDG
jgi:hypothetical protein